MRRDVKVTLFGILMIAGGVLTAGIGTQVVALLMRESPDSSLPVIAKNDPAQATKEVTAFEIYTLLEQKSPPFLLDIRSPEEYATAHIRGAVSIPQTELGTRIGELPRDRKIVVYCRFGPQALAAAPALQGAGVTDVAALTGGFREWSALWDAKKYAACGSTPDGACP